MAKKRLPEPHRLHMSRVGANPNYGLRSTIPSGVAKLLNLEVGDYLRWVVVSGNGNGPPSIIVSKAD